MAPLVVDDIAVQSGIVISDETLTQGQQSDTHLYA